MVLRLTSSWAVSHKPVSGSCVLKGCASSFNSCSCSSSCVRSSVLWKDGSPPELVERCEGLDELLLRATRTFPAAALNGFFILDREEQRTPLGQERLVQ